MLIIPLENKLDWRRPPVITLMLVLINCWVFFDYQSHDHEHFERAMRSYQSAGLLEREAPLFLDYKGIEGADPRDPVLVELIVTDIEFDAEVAPHIGDDVDWQLARARVETQRSRVSSLRWGLIPNDNRPVTYLTSMFLHGGFGHLLGNMVFLFVFGFALELVLGRLAFAALYLAGGMLGAVPHTLVEAGSVVPMVGASGAVSVLMGAYLAVYRLRHIRFFYNVLVYFGEFRAPALLLLPFWIAKELYGYWLGDDNVAYWVHIGGLIAGAGLAYLLTWYGRTIDTEYMAHNERAAHETSEREKLDALIDGFKFEPAKALAARMLEAAPHDVELWHKYLGLMRTNVDAPDYHRAALDVMKRAQQRRLPTPMAELIHDTYCHYAAGHHPQPALRSHALRTRLAIVFATSGHLDTAHDLVKRLLAGKAQEPSLSKLLTLMINRCEQQGAAKAAAQYRTELESRFPQQVL